MTQLARGEGRTREATDAIDGAALRFRQARRDCLNLPREGKVGDPIEVASAGPAQVATLEGRRVS